MGVFEKRTSMFTVLDTNLWVWPTTWIENRDLTFLNPAKFKWLFILDSRLGFGLETIRVS